MLSANKSTRVKIEGKEYLYFGGTNYLGLAQRPELLEAACQAFSLFGLSSGASRLTSGENNILLSLEEELAQFARAEQSLVLPAGFLANQAVVDGLDDEVDAWVISDHAHASIKAAVKQSRKPVMVLDSCCEAESYSPGDRFGAGSFDRLAIFAEPIEPLTGKLVDIAQFYSRAGKNDFIILDEAQSFAVLGVSGRGALEHFALPANAGLIRTGTFSKALGTYGGFILAQTDIINLIKHKALCFSGSTSLPPLLCSATRASLRLIQEDAGSTVCRLQKNLDLLNQLLTESGFSTLNDACVPIYYLPFSPDVVRMRNALPGNDILIPSVGNYFAGACEIGLRWTIQAGHTAEDLHKLIKVFCSSRLQSCQ